ncbi:hypothetical protein ACQEVC_24440 [Plantactinospora sp. CA-294935]
MTTEQLPHAHLGEVQGEVRVDLFDEWGDQRVEGGDCLDEVLLAAGE